MLKIWEPPPIGPPFTALVPFVLASPAAVHRNTHPLAGWCEISPQCSRPLRVLRGKNSGTINDAVRVTLMKNDAVRSRGAASPRAVF